MTKQGNARNCFVCGYDNPAGLHLHFYQNAPGEVTARFRLQKQFEGWRGVIHGGIIVAMLDEAAGRAFLTGAELDVFLFTVKLTIRYRAPVPIETELELRGKAGEARRGVRFASSEITDGKGKVYAEADVVLTQIPDPALSETTVAPSDWLVIPEEMAAQ